MRSAPVIPLAPLNRLLVHPKIPSICGVIAAILALPSLWVGFQIDDYWHRMILAGFTGFPGLYDSFWQLFTYADGTPERTQRFIDYGFFPWWHELSSHTMLWRPVSVCTHWLDHALWPDIALAQHIQNLTWFSAAAAAAAILYRRIHGTTWIAGAAALLFAVDDAHGWVVGWIANRNALMSAFFGILALASHDKWRKDDSPAAAFLAPVWLALAMLSAEASLAVAAYLFAYACFIEKTSLRDRIYSLLPAAIVIGTWQILYRILGFGAWGIELYIDPGREPLHFLHATLLRLPYLLLGQWALPPSDLYLSIRVDFAAPAAACAAAGLFLIAVPLALALWRDDVARFWAFGMFASAIPISSTLPQDRLLYFVGLGAFGLIAQFIHTVFVEKSPIPARRYAVCIAALFVLIHGVAAAIALPIRSYSPTLLGHITEAIRTAEFDESADGQTVVIVNAPTHFYSMYFPVIRSLENLPTPNRVRSLGPDPETFRFTPVAMQLRRIDERTISIRPEGGYVARPLLRDASKPLRKGDVIRVEGMTANVVDSSARGNPAEVEFQFDVSLNDPSLHWLQWIDGRLVRFPVPDIGQEVRL